MFDTQPLAVLNRRLKAVETSITHFQVKDDGSTGQATTTSAVDLSGMWASPDHTGTGFSWADGVLTVSASDVLEFDVSVHTYQTANNRHELHVQLHEDTGGGYSKIFEASQYASRNTAQDEGGCTIPGFKIFNISEGTKYKLQVLHVGVAGTVGASQVAGQTYISAKRYS